MLFWITLIVLLVGIGLIVAGSINWDCTKHHFLWYYDEELGFLGCITALISGIIAAVMLVVIIVSNVGIDAQIERHKARYEALTYKLESDAYRDGFGILNKSVIDEIQDWNEDLVYYKVIQDDFWLGIFHPNIYDEFETIDYERFKKEQGE